MKRTLSKILICVLLIQLFSVTAFADCAPKPSTVIHVNSEDSDFVITLLNQGRCGPHTEVDPEDENPEQTPQRVAAWDAFAAYEDAEGFCFLGEIYTTSVNWAYYAPTEFKIAIYFPEEDTLLVSREVFETYAFTSTFQLDLDGLDRSKSGTVSMNLRKDMDWGGEIFGFLTRVVLTLLIEFAIAWIWGYRSRRQMKVLLGVNLVTQVVLNLLLSMWVIFDGMFMAIFYLAAGEVIVLIIESIFYLRRLPEGDQGLRSSKSWAWWYTLVANAASWGLGYWILKLMK